ncbi:dihydrofolate reductase family protein [Streptomonospora sp. S1-112]|uniref:Dihydrofolate reductase family protein n=1 Tax=Streptomonospora mangrovi TaxID=2883123 RepID=A0A9X3NL50_9ACTN|nr:dihydrofolate reductase family protein [Streptomonospora mangrovi]MDA0564093.1 dihydrofolate reductase family protein [Streptomonospora mangrovi]
MPDRPLPYTILSWAMSLDGYIDDTSPERLRLSSEADFDEIDALRAECDAILVGAGTIRSDNPRLLVRSARRRERRSALGKTGDIVKVVLSERGSVDPAARVFTTGDAAKLVYVASAAHPATARRFATPAPASTTAPTPADADAGTAAAADVTVVDAGPDCDLAGILADLAERGVGRLLVEGGTGVHTRFLTAGLADEVRVAIAPFFVGDPGAPRFVGAGDFANHPRRPMRLAEARALGDMAVLRYLPQAPLTPESASPSPAGSDR